MGSRLSQKLGGDDGNSFNVMAGLGPAIHELFFCIERKTWMPGASPAMTMMFRTRESKQPKEL